MAWNRPTSNTGNATSSSRPSGRGKMPRLRRGLLAGVIVVLGAGLAVWLLMNGEADSRPLQKKERGRIKEVKPAAAPIEVKGETRTTNKSDEASDPAKRIVKVFSCRTNSASGTVCTRYQTADGKTHRRLESATPEIFRHGTDDMLAMALCADLRHSMPPLPGGGNMDKEFLASLNDPIVIGPDDSPEIASRKQTVIDARARVKELMDQGASFSEILADHQRIFNENVKIRNEATRELQRIVDSGDTEGTRQYLFKVNLALQQMGIAELDEPKTAEERRAERTQMRAERAAAKEQAK